MTTFVFYIYVSYPNLFSTNILRFSRDSHCDTQTISGDINGHINSSLT